MMNNEIASLMNNEELWYIFFENMILNNIGVADTSIIHLLYKQLFIVPDTVICFVSSVDVLEEMAYNGTP